jgi:hypothetical protein
MIKKPIIFCYWRTARKIKERAYCSTQHEEIMAENASKS